MRYLKEWCLRENIPPMLEQIDLQRAYAFADDLKLTTGTTHVTCNKYLGRLAAYWQYLGGRVPAARQNVFAGSSSRARRRSGNRRSVRSPTGNSPPC